MPQIHMSSDIDFSVLYLAKPSDLERFLKKQEDMTKNGRDPFQFEDKISICDENDHSNKELVDSESIMDTTEVIERNDSMHEFVPKFIDDLINGLPVEMSNAVGSQEDMFAPTQSEGDGNASEDEGYVTIEKVEDSIESDFAEGSSVSLLK